MINPCDGQTDEQTELRWLRAIATAAVARKNGVINYDFLNVGLQQFGEL